MRRGEGEERKFGIPLSQALSEDWLGSCLTFLSPFLELVPQISKLKSSE